jgi:nucleoside-diphosphate-sugar epimerase
LKALIIGGNRFLGHELALRLVAAGHAVTLFNRGTLKDALGGRVERLHGDRTTGDFERLLEGRRFEAVIDFAAFDADDARRAAAVLGRVGHYVAISTGQVYLVRAGCPRPARESDYDGPLVEAPMDAFDRGQWDYGVKKRGLEDELARAWDARRFPATRLRLPMVSGERDHFRRIERYLWRLLDGGPLLLPGGGEHTTRHVYSGSVVGAILSLLGNAASFGRAYNLAQDETPTLRELVTTLAAALGAEPRFVDVSHDALRAAGLDPLVLSPFSGRWMSFVDPSLAKAELGFRHEPLARYLDKIVTCFLAHPPQPPPPGYELRARERQLAVDGSPRQRAGSRP